MSEKRAVILSSVRTGSTWLGETLRQHPAITYDEELLLEASTVLSGSGQRFNAQTAWAYVQSFADMAKTTWHLWKGQSYQLTDKRLLPDFLDKLIRDPALAVILLRRENLLHWFVSIKVSEALQVYTRRVGDVIPEVEPFEIDPDEIEHYMKVEMAWWKLAREAFPDRPRYTETTYAALCRDYVGEAARLFRFLDLNPVGVKTTTLQMRTRDPRRQVTNYEALCERFRGTEYEKHGFDG